MSMREAWFPSRWIPILLFLSCSMFGCGDEPSKPKVEAPLPDNQTPQNTILRLVATYEQKKLSEYRDLFTGDFTFEFSNSVDPVPVTRWSGGWFAADESASARHLFFGGTNLDGYLQAGASTIDVNLSPTLPIGDTGRDSVTHKTLVAGLIGVPRVWWTSASIRLTPEGDANVHETERRASPLGV